jgi:hypothetical protein
VILEEHTMSRPRTPSRIRIRTRLVTFGVALLATHATAQTAPDPAGYRSESRPLPAQADTVAVVASGIVHFDGTRLVLDDGTAPRTLLTLAAPTFGSFVVPLDGDDLLFGESSGGVWLVRHSGATVPPRKLADVPFAYDAARWTATHALLSAKTRGLAAPDNDVLAIDLSTGAIDPVAVLPGASGPIVVTRGGELIYATASTLFPPPAGSVEVLRYTAAQLLGALGPTALDRSAATLVHAGLDTASDLALDDDDDVFVVDWQAGAVLEIDDLAAAAAARRTLLAYPSGAATAISLQFVGGHSGAAVFEPFQPTNGGRLVLFESDFASTRRLRSLEPRRAELTTTPANPVAPGPFTLSMSHGLASANFVAAIAAAGSGIEQPLALAGFEAPLFWDTALAAPLALIGGTLDANGTFQWPLVNPGPQIPVGFAIQVAFLGAGANAPIGSSRPFTLTLR